MIKFANIQAAWPFIHQKLQGKYPGELPQMSKLKFESGLNSTDPNAVGFVTTEDADKDGKLDTIHLQFQKLEQALNTAGITPQDLANINQLEENKLNVLLEAVVEILAHEQGHIKDYQHGAENPFPGGESTAETAAQNALQQFKSRASIIRAAQKLDDAGYLKYAKLLDNLIDDTPGGEIVDLNLFRETGEKEEPSYEIVVLSDQDTWDGDGYLVNLNAYEYDQLLSGEELSQILGYNFENIDDDRIRVISDLAR